jgi:hypothetical protein
MQRIAVRMARVVKPGLVIESPESTTIVSPSHFAIE